MGMGNTNVITVMSEALCFDTETLLFATLALVMEYEMSLQRVIRPKLSEQLPCIYLLA